MKIEKYYQGRIADGSSFDTVFLKYPKDLRPHAATNYLVREASGSYLIQPFKNGSNRIFLRMQRFGHRILNVAP